MDADNFTDKSDQDNHGQKPEKREPVFVSSFKRWIRMVSLALVIIFVPEQVSWAVGYSPSVFWHNPAAAASPLIPPAQLSAPTITNELLAENLRRSLRPLVNKSLNQINFGQGLALNLGDKPKKLSRDKAELVYKWLANPETEAIH
ncbi:MAG: hypothetical protein NC914_01200, partial [Candidatus Omnitrophica bacterium]|nr:hypothetical protein [Candidatus Omnitrophota bacterium]